MNLLVLAGAALAFVVVEMTATWWAARPLRNFGIVDVVWSFGFAPVALLFLLLSGEGQPLHERVAPVVLVAMMVLWSVRLGSHLFVRVRSHHPVEDVRYARLRAEWGPRTDAKMYRFFLLQGVLQVVLALPAAWVCLDPARRDGVAGLGISGVAGVVIWALGIVGESVADRQLARFRAQPGNKGKVCDVGMWRWSRHPNYFFEWLVWVGYAVFAGGSAWGWLGGLSPVLMLHFLMNVTGIPMTEALSVESKGEAYRRYQRTTSAFFPWPPRPDPTPAPASHHAP
jgi:steroid 5-alpha reductase family enzyme